MSLGIIVNPVSGPPTGRVPSGGARVELARRLAARVDRSIDVVTTNGDGHAAELAGRFVSQGCSRVVVWGGDGTINEAAGPLIGSHAALGIVPAGSGDGLAHGLGLRRDPEEAFTAALTHPVEPVDVGVLGDRHFLNIGGIGFDADVAAAFNRRPVRGQAGYLIDSLRRIWTYQSQAYAVHIAGECLQGPCFVVAFANCREYRSGLVMVPHASPTDGHLDMVLVSGGSPWRQLWRARRLTWRRLAPAEGVRRARVTSASVHAEILHCHVDGQTFDATGRLSVGIKPRAILIAGVKAGQ